MNISYFLEKDKVNIEDCYFHSFPLEKNIYQNILNSGLKSKILRGTIDHESTNNGTFYISLFQNTNEKNLLSILEENPLLIIKSNVIVKKTLSNPICLCLTNTIFPIRYSSYNNEYQKFLYLSSKYIIGVRFSLMDKNLEKNLWWMQKLMRWEEEIYKNILYIDKESNRIINKERVRKLSLEEY